MCGCQQHLAGWKLKGPGCCRLRTRLQSFYNTQLERRHAVRPPVSAPCLLMPSDPCLCSVSTPGHAASGPIGALARRAVGGGVLPSLSHSLHGLQFITRLGLVGLGVCWLPSVWPKCLRGSWRCLPLLAVPQTGRWQAGWVACWHCTDSARKCSMGVMSGALRRWLLRWLVARKMVPAEGGLLPPDAAAALPTHG